MCVCVFEVFLESRWGLLLSLLPCKQSSIPSPPSFGKHFLEKLQPADYKASPSNCCLSFSPSTHAIISWPISAWRNMTHAEHKWCYSRFSLTMNVVFSFQAASPFLRLEALKICFRDSCLFLCFDWTHCLVKTMCKIFAAGRNEPPILIVVAAEL